MIRYVLYLLVEVHRRLYVSAPDRGSNKESLTDYTDGFHAYARRMGTMGSRTSSLSIAKRIRQQKNSRDNP